jgi:hypothetical protein
MGTSFHKDFEGVELMAGASRTLKLSILGDVDNLAKSLKTANSDVESSSTKMGDFGKKAGLAFAAAGIAAAAYAVKIGVDGVKAAIEDEAAQVKLATALTNVTGATTAQIAEVEKQILKTSLLTGVTDDELRPSFERLLRSTQDSSEALKLQQLALDIAAGSGKSLEAVTNALGKGLDGSTGALGKLGIGLSTTELKAMSMEQITAKLADTFGGQAAAKADTFQGRMARLKVAFTESVETIGFALLPILQKLVDLITTYVLPVVEKFSELMSNKSADGLGTRITQVVDVIKSFALPVFEGLKKAFDKVKAAVMENIDEFKSFFEVVKFLAPVIGKIMGGVFNVLGKIAAITINVFAGVLAAIKPVLNFAIDAINLIIKGINLIKTGEDIGLIPKITSGPKVTDLGMIPGTETVKTPTVVMPTVNIPDTPGGGVSTAANSGAQAAIKLSPSVAREGMLGGLGAGVIAGVTGQGQNASVAQVGMLGGLGAGVVAGVNITVNQGIVGDQESAARAVVDVLNNSFYRGTGGASALVAL